MPTTILGALRKRVIAPPMNITSFAVRGFQDTPARWQLEESARQVGMGFEIAIETKGNDDIADRLELLEKQFRGLAYEGAVFALALRDIMSPRPGHKNVESFIGVGGRGAHQVFMAYIGIGFACARVPKFLWKRAFPNQALLPESPALNWMILDGYSFHEAYFKTKKWVDGQYISPKVPWDGPHDYVLRAMDHGIGRAMWFINGGDVERLTRMIGGFKPARHSDLWSGAALAASYAGGVGEDALTDFLKAAWDYKAEVAQGAVFAIKQRVLSDLVTPHTELASQIFCEMTPEEAASLTDKASANIPEGKVPGYEIFRQRIQSNFTGSTVVQ
jgi:enediyne biosynthesis protein E2